MLDDERTRPTTHKAASADLWRVSLRAFISRSAANISAAAKANIEAAPQSPGFAVRAVMTLSALGDLDAAFAVAEGFLLRTGPLVGTLWTADTEMRVNDHAWRRTMNLFAPATAAMRADKRFRSLCDGMGMMRYWKERGIGPDAMFPIA